MVISLIGLQIVLPLLLIAGLAIAPPRNRLGFFLQALVTAVTLVAIARLGVWMFPPWWTPYLYGVLLVMALVIGLRRLKSLQPLPSHWLGWVAMVVFVALGVLVGNAARQSWTGRIPPSIPNEPHLHISAQRPGSPDAPLSGEPLPMQFAGHFLIRGDRITQP